MARQWKCVLRSGCRVATSRAGSGSAQLLRRRRVAAQSVSSTQCWLPLALCSCEAVRCLAACKLSDEREACVSRAELS